MVVQSTAAADRVYEVAEEIKNRAQASGKFIVVQNSLSFDTPKVNLTIDRARAAALGVSVADIGNTLTLLVDENGISKFDREARAYDIITQVPQQFRNNWRASVRSSSARNPARWCRSRPWSRCRREAPRPRSSSSTS